MVQSDLRSEIPSTRAKSQVSIANDELTAQLSQLSGLNGMYRGIGLVYDAKHLFYDYSFIGLLFGVYKGCGGERNLKPEWKIPYGDVVGIDLDGYYKAGRLFGRTLMHSKLRSVTAFNNAMKNDVADRLTEYLFKVDMGETFGVSDAVFSLTNRDGKKVDITHVVSSTCDCVNFTGASPVYLAMRLERIDSRRQGKAIADILKIYSKIGESLT